MSNQQNHIWSFPLVGGVLTLIGLLTPASIVLGNFTWLFGLIYYDLDPLSLFFYWNPFVFLVNLIPLIILLSLSIAAIILSAISRSEQDFIRFKKIFFILGGLFFIPSLIHLIWAAIFFRSFGIPGFAFIAPMISGALIIFGTLCNSRVLIPRSQRSDLILKIKKCYRRILISFSVGAMIFLVGSYISFFLINIIPGDPVIGYLIAMGIGTPTPAQIAAARAALGLDLPIFLQYIRFLCQTFSGNWGISFSYAISTPVIELIGSRVPRMIEVVALPLIIVFGLAILLGRFLAKKKGRWFAKLIQLGYIVGLSLPVFFIGMVCQYSLGSIGIIPTSGYKNPAYSNPTFRTGFLIFDSLLDLNFALAIDIFHHLLTPMVIFGLVAFLLITWQTRSSRLNKSHHNSFFRHAVITGSIFGFLFMFYLLIDITFGLYGFGTLIIDSINLSDHFLLIRSVFTLVSILVVVLVISMISFSLYKYIKSVRVQPKSESKLDEITNSQKGRNPNTSEENIKDFIIRKVKSPLGIVSIALMIFFIVITLFPQLITQYTLQEALTIQPGAFNPPSPDHPLGQTELGRDLLGLVMYGIKESMVFGFMAILIGMAGGVPLGYLAGRFRKWGYRVIMAYMIFIYVIPVFLYAILIGNTFGMYYFFTLQIIGLFLIPNFTRAIANLISGNFRTDIHRIGKTLLSHIPLNFAIAVSIYTAIGYLGFSSFQIYQQLGNLTNIARPYLYGAPLASFWPGMAIFGIILTFLLFYLAFQNHGQLSKTFEVKFRKIEKEPIEIRME